MADPLDLGCRCGAVRMTLAVPARRAGTRLVCYCADCQTAARHFGPGDALLSPAGGTDVWQTTPDLIEITQGADQLAILRLSPKGLFRWHATCCDTPLFNTLPRLGFPFVSLVLRPEQAEMADILGPPAGYNATASARPGQGAPTADSGIRYAVRTLFQRALGAWLSGRARNSPLRAPDGSAIAPVKMLTLEERKAARPDRQAR